MEANDPQINTITCGPQVHQSAVTHSLLACQIPFSILSVELRELTWEELVSI